MTDFEGIETTEMLGEIDTVVKQHLTQQMNKIISENNFLKQNVNALRDLPIIKNYEADVKKLRHLNKLLIRKVAKMKEKLEEYENYANLNLEIKEITRDPSQILRLDSNNWQQLILKDDMENMGLNNSDEDDDEGNESDDYEDQGGPAEDTDEEDEEDDDKDEEDDDKDEEDDMDLGSETEGGGDESNDLEEPISIEHDIAVEDNEISDEEEEHKEWVWAETGDKYFINDEGKLFENIDGKIGKVVGRLEEGVAFFS